MRYQAPRNRIVRAWLHGVVGDSANPSHLEKALRYRVPPPILERLHIAMGSRRIMCYSDLSRNTASVCLREAYDEFVREHAQRRLCKLRNDLMVRTIKAYKKPLPQGCIPILEDEPE